jgi:hypothetical protein
MGNTSPIYPYRTELSDWNILILLRRSLNLLSRNKTNSETFLALSVT